jgi:ParB family chromosome partitioning protein
MATAKAKTKTPRKKATRATTKRTRGKLAPGSTARGLDAAQVAIAMDSAEIAEVVAQVRGAGGAPIGAYRDPLGGHALVLASLPLGALQPTPFQRDLSPTHAKRLALKIDETAAFLDPLIVVRGEDGRFWTPNGRHRLAAGKVLGLKQITVLISPDETLAYRILALNTEKAHNLREKSLETIRMARALAGAKTSKDEQESAFAFEFEQPSFLTLGAAYEERPRLSGGAYQPILRRVDQFLDEPMSKALKERDRRSRKFLKLDDAVGAAVEKLKAKGLTSPYLKPFVVARVNYTRFSKATSFDYDETLDKIIASAQKFNVERVSQQDVAKAGGGPPPDEE